MCAFIPRLVFLPAFVTNDNLVDALGAGLTLIALRCLTLPTASRFAMLGVILALLVITKLSAIPVILVILPVAYGVTGLARRVQLVAIACGAALLACGWYLVQNIVRYGDPLASTATTHYLTPIGGLGTFGFLYHVTHPLHLVFVEVPRAIWNGFWYTSGWNQYRGAASSDWCVRSLTRGRGACRRPRENRVRFSLPCEPRRQRNLQSARRGR